MIIIYTEKCEEADITIQSKDSSISSSIKNNVGFFFFQSGKYYRLYGHEFEQAPGVGDGQGVLECCSPWGRRVRHDCVTGLN